MKKADFATRLERMGLIAAASLLMIGSGSAAFAQRSGGFHGGGGGFHASGGFHGSAGFHGSGGFRAGGAFRGGGFYRGGFRGGYRGYYGYRGGGYGWGWGPAWGLGFGVYLATLPWYYSTFWWGGVPYYYAQNDYYVWDSDADEYEQVQPPPQVAEAAQGDQPVQSGRQQAPNGAVTEAPPQLYAYPKNGQTAQQQVMDKRECGRWASTQTGLYPATDAAANTPGQGTATGNVGAPATAEQWQNYLRAESACLEAHGYTVE
ncbi:MAG: hypothetical protein WAU49_03155 [Steroidobacteraceae bacterium]